MKSVLIILSMIIFSVSLAENGVKPIKQLIFPNHISETTKDKNGFEASIINYYGRPIKIIPNSNF